MTGIYLVLALVVYSLMGAIHVFRGGVLLRLTMITYAFVVASLVYFSFETYKGWPAKEKATEGEIVAIRVVDPAGENPGAIYFWVVGSKQLSWIEGLYTYASDLPSSPRAFYLPYTKNAAQAFRQAQKALQDGQRVSIDDTDEGDGEKSDDQPDGKSKDPAHGGDSVVEDYDVPHLEIISPQDFLKKE